jgi:hypothetical protein
VLRTSQPVGTTSDGAVPNSVPLQRAEAMAGRNSPGAIVDLCGGRDGGGAQSCEAFRDCMIHEY